MSDLEIIIACAKMALAIAAGSTFISLALFVPPYLVLRFIANRKIRK